MNDLEKARLALKNRDLNLVLVRDGELIFESRLPRVKGLLEIRENVGEKTRESSLGDKVVGKAVALICAYLEVQAVFGGVMSEGAEEVLENEGIPHIHEKLVPFIKDEKDGTPCPFEELVKNWEDPEKAYWELKSRVQ